MAINTEHNAPPNTRLTENGKRREGRKKVRDNRFITKLNKIVATVKMCYKIRNVFGVH